MQINYILFICSLVEGYQGYLQLLAITNKAAMNIVEGMSLWNGGAYFGYIPRSGIPMREDYLQLFEKLPN